MTSISIRQEHPDDAPFVFDLIRGAFADMEESDHQEQFLVERLHASATFVPELSLVAHSDDGQIVGYVLLTEAEIVSDSVSTTTLAVAPLAVAPQFQKQGIGTKLLTKAHEIAKVLGYETAVVLGHADYYPRFGYQKANVCGVKFPFEAPDECCMIIELQPGALQKTRGTVQYPVAFFE